MAVKHTTVGGIIADAMQERGVGIRELAEQLELTYEHTRRIVRGEYTPNKFTLKPICDFLGLNFDEAWQTGLGERIRKKYGVVADSLTPKSKGLEPIEKVWEDLTKEQQHDAVGMITAWAKNNRKERASKGV